MTQENEGSRENLVEKQKKYPTTGEVEKSWNPGKKKVKERRRKSQGKKKVLLGFLAWLRCFAWLPCLASLLGFQLAWLGFGLLGSELSRKLRFKPNHESQNPVVQWVDLGSFWDLQNTYLACILTHRPDTEFQV